VTSSSRDVRPVRIVVVDDNEHLRVSLAEMLQDMGLLVLGQGGNGREAIELVDTLEPEVVLMDIRMPEMDGLAAARIIKDRHPVVQVVILSAYDDPSLQHKADEASVAFYLVKGCNPELTRNALLAAAEMHRALKCGSDAPGDEMVGEAKN
jgi:YesN/AraC family two-component response regulator